jgi:simple sugar transport system permease protein
VVPVPAVVLAVIALVLWFVMDFTRFGRIFYAVGGNELAARLAGAPTQLYCVLAYVISSVIV